MSRAEGQTDTDRPPLIAHVIYNMRLGGLENGLVNLLDNLPRDRYRHVVICIKDYSDFRFRVQRDDVEFIALHKKEGKALGIYKKLYEVFRKLQPSIVHSRNLAGLDAQLPAFLAGVPCRIHAEHGRDMRDLDGGNPKYRFLLRVHSVLINEFVSVSQDLARHLVDKVGISARKVRHIYNGVDTRRFTQTAERGADPPGLDFAAEDSIVVGTVSRLQQVKNPANLANAFVVLLGKAPDLRARLRLVIAGDGPLKDEVTSILADANVLDQVWLPGFSDDIPAILGGLDIFVLSSLAEGISNTILEAMASGLPVVATDVGGNREVVTPGQTGTLVPSDDPDALADAILSYARDPAMARQHGLAGRHKVDAQFSLRAMVDGYDALYTELLAATETWR